MFFKFLRKNVLFNHLDDRELEKVASLVYHREYKKNEIVFFQNDPSQALYIVNKGAIRMYVTHDEMDETLMEIQDGYVFGQNSIMRKTRRLYNAIVISDHCELLVIPQESLFELFEKDKEIKAKLLETLVIYYNSYITKLFSKYKEKFGFFELSSIYEQE